MSDIPIIDTAIRAACDDLGGPACTMPACAIDGSGCDIPTLIKAALRTASPWDLPPDRLEAMARGAFRVVGDEVPLGYIRAVLAAYRADPIFKELYPEKFA